MIELVLDPDEQRILDVNSTVKLPGYKALLQRLFIGRRLDEVEEVARSFCTRCRGPLVKPTIAALLNAVANSKKQTQDLALAMNSPQD